MVASICIGGPSPMRVGGWEVRRSYFLPRESALTLCHQQTGQIITGAGAQGLLDYMLDTGVPLAMLDRRSWIWTSYAYDRTRLTLDALDSWPDERPYPYPESVRTEALARRAAPS